MDDRFNGVGTMPIRLGIATVPLKKMEGGVDTFLSSPTWIPEMQELRLRGRVFGRSPVVGGSRNSIAITDLGEIYSWGWNQRGSLGAGHKLIERTPKKVESLSGVKICQAAVGGWHALALSEDGQVYAWGGNEYNQCALYQRGGAGRDVCMPVPILQDLKVRQVAAGGMHSMALAEDGTVWAWGQPLCDYTNNSQRLPAPIPFFGTSNKIAKVSAGAFHNLALQEDGTLLSWGRNEYGSLGHGNTTYNSKPNPIALFKERNIKIKDMACGGWHSAAITTDGEMYIWGRGEYGRLGLGDDCSVRLLPTVLKLPHGETAVQVSCGGTHTLFLTASHRVMTCGRGSFGRQAQEAVGSNDFFRDLNTPEYVEFAGGPWTALSVSAGGRHSIVVVELKNRRASIISSPDVLTPEGHFAPVVQDLSGSECDSAGTSPLVTPMKHLPERLLERMSEEDVEHPGYRAS